MELTEKFTGTGYDMVDTPIHSSSYDCCNIGLLPVNINPTSFDKCFSGHHYYCNDTS